MSVRECCDLDPVATYTPCQPRLIKLTAMAARRSATIFETPRRPCLPIQRATRSAFQKAIATKKAQAQDQLAAQVARKNGPPPDDLDECLPASSTWSRHHALERVESAVDVLDTGVGGEAEPAGGGRCQLEVEMGQGGAVTAGARFDAVLVHGVSVVDLFVVETELTYRSWPATPPFVPRQTRCGSGVTTGQVVGVLDWAAPPP